MKPSEALAYRRAEEGGLGLICVKVRAQAQLMHSFIQQAIHPLYRRNYFLNALFRWYVLEETDGPKPLCPPYYSSTFFDQIKHVRNISSVNIEWMTISQIYRELMNDSISHEREEMVSLPVAIPSRTEALYPNISWDRSHRISRQPGLTPQQKSFLFLMKNDLLMTRERLFRLKKAPDPLCIQCNAIDDNVHQLNCLASNQVTKPVTDLLLLYMPEITPEQMLCLDWEVEGSAAELPLLWIFTVGFTYIINNLHMGDKEVTKAGEI